jgi:hypothetical protein
MMHYKLCLLALGTTLLTAPLVSGTGQAMPGISLSGAALVQPVADGANPLHLAQATNEERRRANRQDRRDRRLRTNWDRRRDGRRCDRRYADCRYFYRGAYYETPWWTLPLIIGGGIIAGGINDRGGYSSRHVEWCQDRYRSYNVRTNTWVAYSGQVRQCDSPYG